MSSYDDGVIVDFLEQYLHTLETLLNNEYNHVFKLGFETNISLKFPVKTFVFRGERGLHFGFEPSDSFDIIFARALFQVPNLTYYGN